MKTKGGKARKDKKVILLITLLLLIIVALVGVVVYLLRPKDSPNEEDVKPMIVTEENKDEIIGELEENSADTMFNCRMSYDWTFKNGEAESEDAYVANTDYNHYTIYFEVQINSTEEIVYRSAYVPVGSEVKGLTLDKPLKAGDYPATVIYHLVDDKEQEVSSVGFTINIHVLH